MLKDILVLVDEAQWSRRLVEVAAVLAARHDALLTGLHAIDVPQIPSYGGVEIPESVRASQRQSFLDRADEAKRVFDAACGQAQVHGEWVCENCSPTLALNRHAVHSDLLMMHRDPIKYSEHLLSNLAGDVALGVGRPVIVVPPETAVESIGNKVTLAWNATPESARALSDALPILVDAGEVNVVWVKPRGEDAADQVLAAVCAHLERHGVAARPQAVAASRDVAKSILGVALDSGSDLLVMGAYGHSRMREFLFGGVTEHMLENCTMPVFMSH